MIVRLSPFLIVPSLKKTTNRLGGKNACVCMRKVEKKRKILNKVGEKLVHLNKYGGEQVNSVRFNSLLRNIQTFISMRYEDVMKNTKNKSDTFFDILYVYYQMKCLDLFFGSKRNHYMIEDKVSFYDFLILLNATLDQFIEDTNIE